MEEDKQELYIDDDRVEDMNEVVVEEEVGGDGYVEEDNEDGEGGGDDVDDVVKDILDDDEDNSFEILAEYFVFHRHLRYKKRYKKCKLNHWQKIKNH